MIGLHVWDNLPGWQRPALFEFNGVEPDSAVANLRLGEESSALYGQWELDGETHEILIAHVRWGDGRPPRVTLDNLPTTGLRLDYGYSVHNGHEIHANYELRGHMLGRTGESVLSVKFVAERPHVGLDG